MRFIEFIILLLEAHAETLRQLALFFGEAELLQLLEEYGDRYEEITQGGPDKRAQTLLEKLTLDPPAAKAPHLAYPELEGAVHSMNLPAVLEFHLWAYPFYRALIESPLELQGRIPTFHPFQPSHSGDTGSLLVEEALAQAQSWIQHLPIPPQLSQHAEKAASTAWLRFRTQALKRIGKRPLGPVY